MGTADFMSERERQDLRDAGRGHLIDGGRLAVLIDKADELRKLEREEGVAGGDAGKPASGAAESAATRSPHHGGDQK